MKKKLLFGIAYVLLFVQLGGCSKSFQEDQLPQNAETLQSARIARAAIPTCRIEKITSWSVFDPPKIAKFSYNLKGDPTQVAFNRTGTGSPQLSFRYDQKHRLSDYIAPYYLDDPNSAYEFWFNYQYDQKGRVLVDTGYLFGNLVNNIPQPNPFYKSYSNYEYDAENRLSRVTRTFLQNGQSFVTVDTYEYDDKGNLLGYGPYDDKVNIHQTSKVWEFIDRNYSKNNPVAARSYNMLNYPLQFDTTTSFWFTLFNQIDLQQSEIVYQCQQ